MIDITRDSKVDSSPGKKPHWGEDSKKRKLYANSILFITPILLLFLIVRHPPEITLGNACLAALIVMTGTLPSILYLYRNDSAVPLLPLHGMYYTFCYGFPAFSRYLNWRDVSSSGISQALWLVILGLWVLYAAYFSFGILVRNLRPVQFSKQMKPSFLKFWGWVFLTIHLIYQYNPFLKQYVSLDHFFYPLGWIGLCFLYACFLKKQMGLFEKYIFLLIALPLEIISRYISGALAQVLLLFLFLMLIYWHIKKRLPWKLIVAMLLFYMVFNPVKQEYRKYIWSENEKVLSAPEKVQLFTDLAIKYYSGEVLSKALTREENLNTNINRISDIGTLAYVVERTPHTVPYWNGETYQFLFISFIPRFLWPDKPTSAFGNEFGRRYELLGVNDDVTAFNLPWLVEFYANYGFWGVILGMAMVGIGFRFLIAKFGTFHRDSVMEYALAITLYFQLFFAQSNLALMWGGLILAFFCFYILLNFFILF